MNSDAGGGTAAARAEAPAAAVAPKGGAASEGSATQPMNSDAGGGPAAARAEAPAAAVAAKGGAASEDSATQPMNSGAGGGTAGARAEAPAAAVAPKGGAPCEGSDTNSLNSGAGGGTAAADAILARLPNRAARPPGQAHGGRLAGRACTGTRTRLLGQSGEPKQDQGFAPDPTKGFCPLGPLRGPSPFKGGGRGRPRSPLPRRKQNGWIAKAAAFAGVHGAKPPGGFQGGALVLLWFARLPGRHGTNP